MPPLVGELWSWPTLLLALAVVGEVLAVVFVYRVLTRGGSAASTLLWMVVILAAPWLGLLAYYLLPRLGFGAVPPKLAFWQPIIYGAGQLMHIIGLAWTGGYGVQRKVAGAAQGVDRLGEVAGMGLMGLGGLVSVIGGLLFLIVAWKSIRARVRQ